MLSIKKPPNPAPALSRLSAMGTAPGADPDMLALVKEVAAALRYVLVWNHTLQGEIDTLKRND